VVLDRLLGHDQLLSHGPVGEAARDELGNFDFASRQTSGAPVRRWCINALGTPAAQHQLHLDGRNQDDPRVHVGTDARSVGCRQTLPALWSIGAKSPCRCKSFQSPASRR
jgi:hypothetical protein